MSTESPSAATAPNAGDAFWFLGNLGIVRVAGSDTGGRLCVLEVLAPAASGAPPHHHADDEVFCVLEGELRVTVGASEVVAGPGETVHVPGGVAHTYAVSADGPARWLVTNAPAGFDAFVAAIAEPADEHVLPPPPGPAELDAVMGKIVAAAERHGVTMLGGGEA